MRLSLLQRPLAWLLLAAALVVGPVLADDNDHDRARRALESGQILPLRDILDVVETQFPGQVLEVEFDHDDGEFLYEIKVLQTGGRLVKLELDARDGTILRMRNEWYDD